MKLGTAQVGNRTRAFKESGGEYSYFEAEDVGELIATTGWRELPGQAGPEPSRSDLKAPILRPGKIICVGLNYTDHAAEVGKETPTYPTLFAKFANSLIGPADEIQIPHTSISDRIDWEAELVVVIGERVFQADALSARAAILGYSVANDISMRDWQQRTSEWLQGKTFEATTPFGPVIVTSDEWEPSDGHAVECIVDGAIEQSGTTSSMILSPEQIVEYITSFMSLEPGDIILTGTPAGVGMAKGKYLRDGAVVVTRIAGLGELSNRCQTVSTE